jgi:hypothetical protein
LWSATPWHCVGCVAAKGEEGVNIDFTWIAFLLVLLVLIFQDLDLKD